MVGWGAAKRRDAMQRLLLIDDEADVQYSFGRIFSSPEIELVTASSGEEGLKLAPKLKPDLIIMDIRMGGMNGLETLRRLRQFDAKVPVIMMTAYGTTQTAIEAMKLGAYDYLLKPFDIPKLKQLVGEALKASQAMKQAVSFQSSPEAEDDAVGIVGRSEGMQQVFKLIGQLAVSDATVLVTGESGTGKELVARAIYSHSRRNEKPFLAINCAAIPENLLESELFGHERGAFTGASHQRIGKFEQCNGGTIFLDEIGDMSLPTQTKILRVLQSGLFERVGGNQPVQADVRIIAATNKPLEQAVASRQFREDLFYRLNVVRIQLPPLRDRREDIRLLVNYFLKKLVRPQRTALKAISSDALVALEVYHWPGNVRELENVIQRALVMAKSDTILPGDLPPEVLAGRTAGPAGTPPGPTALAPVAPSPIAAAVPTLAAPAPAEPPGGSPRDVSSAVAQLFRWAREDTKLKVLPAVERELVIQALRETHGNQLQAARLLGISRATLRKRMERYGVRKELEITAVSVAQPQPGRP